MLFKIRYSLLSLFLFLNINIFAQDGDCSKREYISYFLEDIIIDLPSDMFVITKTFATTGIDKLPLGLSVNEIQISFEKDNTVLNAFSHDLSSSIEITITKCNDGLNEIDLLTKEELCNLIKSIVFEYKNNMIDISFESIYKSYDVAFLVFTQNQMIEFLVVSKQYHTITKGIDLTISFYSNSNFNEKELTIQRNIVNSLIFVSK
jgi:hypothetical protein